MKHDVQAKIYRYSQVMNNIKVLRLKKRDRRNPSKEFRRDTKVRLYQRKINKIKPRRRFFSPEFYKVNKINNFSYGLKENRSGVEIEGKYKPDEIKIINIDEIELPKRKRRV